jgi:hypothetical protein
MTNHEYAQGLIEQAVERINNGVSKTLTARLQSEAPPLDPRHLTDTRTRVSTLLEYALAYELNHLLIEEGGGRSASAVLWNVFPDLIIRDARRAPLLGLEVKALHTAAEEKSANLSTPLHVIKRGSDFVVIIIWAWRREIIGGVSITYPHIHAAELFDAYLLAQIRDFTWLYNQGNRIKGIDISTPLITSEEQPKGNRFKAEEGNMGKLMRIALEAELPAATPGLADMRVEAERYEHFKTRTLTLGLTETFREICDLQRATNIRCEPPAQYPADLAEVARATLSSGNTISLFAGGGIAHFTRTPPDPVEYPNGAVAVWLSSKLKWAVIKVVEGAWIVVTTGDKPDTAYEKIQAAIVAK